MSFTGGQLFGTLIGGALGIAIPGLGFALGASIGMTIGGIIDPPDEQTSRQEGARLGDLSTQTSSWSTPIPRLFATFGMSGNVIWSLPLHETKHVEESGEGKGNSGGTKTESVWYSYKGSWAVGFCEGEIKGVKKIWFGSVLVYDGNNYSGGLSTGNHDVYLGDDEQMPNWYIQQTHPDTSAYRHLFYIVFKGIELENYGNKIPDVFVEVAEKGVNETVFSYFDVTDNSGCISKESGSIYRSVQEELIINSASNYRFMNSLYSYNSGSLLDVYFTDPIETTPYTAQDVYFESDTPITFTIVDGTILRVTNSLTTDIIADITTYPANLQDYTFYYFNERLYMYGINNSLFSLQEYIIDAFYNLIPEVKYLQSKDNVQFSFDDESIDCLVGNDLQTTFHILSYSDQGYLDSETDISGLVSGYISSASQDTRITKDTSGKVWICCIDSTTIYVHTFDDGTYEFVTSKVIPAQFEYKYPHQSGISFDDDIIYFDGEVSGTQTVGKLYLQNLVDNKVSIEYIMTSLLDRAGVDAQDYDMTAGTDLIDGYVVTTPMTTRNAIGPVLSAYKYDLTEQNGQLVLKKRGNPPITAIDEDDMVGELILERAQELELSREINIIYANSDKRYEAGSQQAKRIDLNTDISKTYQYPISMSDTYGKEIAELYLFSEWAEMTRFKYTIPSNFLFLEVSDVVTINYKGWTYNSRIKKIDYQTDQSLKIEGVSEYEGQYDSKATGSDTNAGNEDYYVDKDEVATFKLLDIPMLDNAYNSEGLYLAVSNISPSWSGASVDKSTDNQISYTPVTQVVGKTITGITTTALADGPTHIWDYNSVTVNTYGSELYSSTPTGVTNAENYILIGNEILQYTTAVDNMDGTYTLSDLLRGRRGTEWATDSHIAGERFVFLSSNMVFDGTAELNVKTFYKVTNFGDFIDDSIAKSITPDIVCLKPLSPWFVRGKRDTNGDLIIVWKTRSRDVTGYLKPLQLFEEAEIYHVEISTGSGRLIIVNSPTATYSAADQIADGITLGDPITVTVYQISGIVGKGYGTEVTI